jgi:hypothetical protein
MTKAILIIRCCIEGLLGMFMLLGAVVPLQQASTGWSGWNDFLSNLTGAVVARVICAACGIALCRDSLKVYRRIQTRTVV